jgi:hypothetical protein
MVKVGLLSYVWVCENNTFKRPDIMEAYAVDVEKPFSAARLKFDEMVTHLQTAVALGMRHEDLEEYVVREGRELERRMLQEHLDLRAAAEKPVKVVGEDGIERSQIRASHRRLMSLVGEVTVSRLLYQATGVAGRAPQDAALNLPSESFSLGIRRRVAEEVAANSFEHGTERIGATTGARIGKRQVEEEARRAAVDFEAFYAGRQPTDIEAEADKLLVLSFDGAGIVMLPGDLREVTRRAAEAQASKERWPRKRLKRGQKRNRKRMVEVAAVYAIEPHVRVPEDIVRELRPVQDVETARRRPKPRGKRVWASVERDAERVIEEAFAEASRRDPERKRRWVVLVDGQEGQLSSIETMAARMGVEITIVLDIIHVLEYLWKAAYCFHPDGSREAEQWVQKRLLMLLSGTSPSDVAAGMARSATLQGLENRQAVEDCANYLCKYRDFLGYARALADGLPIATGVIEGACRYLVRDRMDKTGARWSLAGAEAVLKLRALRANGDFDDYWRFHLDAEHRRNHVARYHHSEVPNPLPTRPRLRRVK